MNLSAVLMIVGAILLCVSSVASVAAIDLFKLGWGLIALGYALGLYAGH